MTLTPYLVYIYLYKKFVTGIKIMMTLIIVDDNDEVRAVCYLHNADPYCVVFGDHDGTS